MMSWSQYKAEYSERQVDECYKEWCKLHNDAKWKQGYSSKHLVKHSREEEELLEKDRESWRIERLETAPNRAVIKRFQKNKALDKFMKSQKLETDAEFKKVTQILEKTLKQLKLYEAASLRNSRPGNYIVFCQLYTIRNQNSSKPYHDNDLTESLNDMVKATGDVNKLYFTAIPELRNEIDGMLKDHAYERTSDRSKCKSFGTHQFFELYASKVQTFLDKLSPKVTEIKLKQNAAAIGKKNEEYICFCGVKSTRNGKSAHEKRKKHTCCWWWLRNFFRSG
jgi:hypothetical protein